MFDDRPGKRKSVKFLFKTDKGPGHVTVSIPVDQDIDEIGEYLLDSIRDKYNTVVITGHEVKEL